MVNYMATAALKIRLSCNQILELAQKLSDEDKLELNRALAAEVKGFKLRKLLEALKNNRNFTRRYRCRGGNNKAGSV